MKRILAVIAVLALVWFAGGATANADTITWPASGFTGITSPDSLTLGGIKFWYDNFGDGTQSAYVSSNGVQGTTGGALYLDFAIPATSLDFSFLLHSFNPAGDLSSVVTAIFSNNEIAWAPGAFASEDVSGLFSYTGPAFSQAAIYFSVDAPNFLLSNVSYTPAPLPGAFLLLTSGMAALGYMRFFHKKSNGNVA